MATILVVDDHPEIATLHAIALRRRGHECPVAHDGAQAWAVLTTRAVDLVLLDVMMPDETGPAFMRRMQLEPTLAAIPVVFITARTDPATEIQCLAMGACGFLTKPVSVRRLIQVVEAGLRSPAEGARAPRDLLETALGRDGAAAAGEGGAHAGAVEDAGPRSVPDLLAERRVLREQLAAHSRLVSAIVRLHRLTGAGYPPDRIANAIVLLAQKVLAASEATVWMAMGEMLVPLATTTDGLPAALLLDDAAAPARVWRNTQDATVADLALTHHQLAVGGDAIGVLSLGTADGPATPSMLVGLFCAEAAIALDAACRLGQAQSEASTDPLTQVANRRQLDRRLAEELRHAQASGQRVSVLFLDLDHFKTINDRGGHEHGDRVLRGVADVLRETLRAVDVVGRYGGEEFVVVLPDTDREGAVVVAERLRGAIAERGELTTTIGTATCPDDARNAQHLVGCADTALLRGKRSGRNRVEVFAGTTSDHPEPAEAPATVRTVLRALLGALKVKDADTARHSAAVARLSARAARHLGLSEELVQRTGHVGTLHDVGKLFIPDEVLLKPAALTEAERVVMERHVALGADLATAIAEIRHLAAAVRASQEFFDGSGYPDGLAGSAIPLEARLVAVADAWEAMVTDRPYRSGMPAAAATAELRRCAGTQFDPDAVAAVLAVVSSHGFAAAEVVA